ncbi:MAG: peptide chain release factor N(5)-glutamine methyltransferase [candidate division Zixibacteria bacterium]|nr:peptide chain release factor N(5)-glutamine methyltransferase [candidate division Zixibacteria bacterium]
MAFIVSDFLRRLIELFSDRGVFEPEISAERILSSITGMSRAELYSANDNIIYNPLIHRAKSAAERRIAGEPLAYITGECEFYNVSLKIDRRVMVPRPDTETLVEEVLKKLQRIEGDKLVADVGTGSGCIAVSLAVNLDRIEVIASDYKAEVIDLAEENAQLNSVNRKIRFVAGNKFEPFGDYNKQFDCIVSNPPYIAGGEKEKLPVEVREYEPAGAIFAGEDGLDFIRELVNESPAFLKRDGFLAMEIGYMQGEAVKDLMREKFYYIELVKDLSGNDRVVIGYRK